MKIHTALLVLLPSLSLAGCRFAEPAKVQGSLTRAENFSAINPRDLAVLEIDDQTGGKLKQLREYMHARLRRELVSRNYSPLGRRHIDANFGRNLGRRAATEGLSIVRPAFMSKLASKAGEDAILAVQVVAWDDSELLLTNRVKFRAHVAMLDSKSRKLLLEGSVAGEVEAGGAGAAPRAPDARARAAVHEFARQLALQLPARHAH